MIDQFVPDFSEFYTGEGVPGEPNPSEDLYRSLAAAQSAPAAEPIVVGPTPAPDPKRGAPSGPATATPTPAPAPASTGTQPATAQANPSSTSTPPASDAALLARLAPFGITDLQQLRSKTDVELRALSQDVVMREERERTLGRSFFRNPDGSWDFTRGPDGRPTGLDATGRPLGSTPDPAAANPAEAQKPIVVGPTPAPGPRTGGPTTGLRNPMDDPSTQKVTAPKKVTTSTAPKSTAAVPRITTPRPVSSNQPR